MRRITIGRVLGHRGGTGELTVRVGCGDAAVWCDVTRVWIDAGAKSLRFDVASRRAYRDRLVLKLVGIDDPNAAQALAGARVEAERADAPRLSAGEYWVEDLVGLAVHDRAQGFVGTLREVRPTGGVDLLVVEVANDPDGEPLLIPLARAIVHEVDPDLGRILIDAPEGLLDLNRESKP